MQSAGSWTFTYDLNGNQLNRYTSAVLDRALTYDNDNRPVTVTQGPATVTYLYGPDGERLKKTTPSGTTLYIADSERDPAGGWTTYPAPELKRAGSVLNWLHRDHLSSVRRITDSTGAITRSSVYKPYGTQVETVVAALSPAEPKGWIGERTDAETGLTYLHARYYDAALGRFLSPDWWDVSDPSVGTDRYGYSLGDPVNKADANGHTAATVVDEDDLLKALTRAITAAANGSGETIGAVVSGGARLLGPVAVFLSMTGPVASGEDSLVHQREASGSGALLSEGSDEVVQPSDDKPSLVDEDRAQHILDSDETGGGHRFGTGLPGKSEFPEGWSDAKILGEISDVATDPSSEVVPGRGERDLVRGTRDGIDIEVVVDRATGRIITAYPTNVPRNPK